MIEVRALQRHKRGGACQPVTLYVEALSSGEIRDAKSGYCYRLSLQDLDGEIHVRLEGPRHAYLVPAGSAVARRLLGGDQVAYSFIAGTPDEPCGHHGTYLCRAHYEAAKGSYATHCYTEPVRVSGQAAAWMRKHRSSYEAYLIAQEWAQAQAFSSRRS